MYVSCVFIYIYFSCVFYILATNVCLVFLFIYSSMINTCFVIIFMYHVLVKFMVYSKLLNEVLIQFNFFVKHKNDSIQHIITCFEFKFYISGGRKWNATFMLFFFK